MNILLVDDDIVDRKTVKRALEKSQLNVSITEASSANDAALLYSQASFDVVLIDYRMPNHNGMELMVALQNDHQYLGAGAVIVMMSTFIDDDIAISCIEAGAQDFLIKSEITATLLRRSIQHATTRFNLEQKLVKTYQQMKILAETDTLTGLANRYYFDETVKKLITNNKRKEHKLALILLDLDNFKLINDNFGHSIGDKLLKAIVKKIKSCLRSGELFARLGGDEFAITLSNLNSVEQASQIARRINLLMEKPINISSTSIHVTASIGIALHPDNGATSEELIKYADIAMYKAKNLGRNRICFFKDEMQTTFLQRLQIEMGLTKAIKHQEFELFYQPVYNPLTNDLKGFEALIRWCKDGEILPPIQFIEVAEETNQIIAIGLWVAEQAIQTLAQWSSQHKTPITIAINVSPKQLGDPNFVDRLEDLFQLYNVSPRCLDIELTETALLEKTTTVNETIYRLNNIGCAISLDDFGTGFSSLSHLQNYPISNLKIDKSLMPQNSLDSKNFTIIEGVVSMARVLGLHIIAEGIETELHLNLCKHLNITSVQGYYYSKPIPYLQAQALLSL